MWRWVTWSVVPFFASTAFQRQVLPLLGPGCQKHHQQVRLPLWPIISGSITSTNFDNLGQVSLFSDWAYQITWQIHKIPNYWANSICCFVRFTFFVWIYTRMTLFFTSPCGLSICPCTLFVCSTPIYLCFSCLSFPPISILLRVLDVLVWTCVVMFYRLWCPLFVLASKEGWVNIMYHGLDSVAVDQQVMLFM